MRANLRLIQRLFGDSKPLILAGVLSAAGQSALLAPIALLVRRIFDRSVPRHDSADIVLAGGLVLVLYCASALLGWISRRVIVRISKQSVGRLRSELIARVYALPASWHDRRAGAELHAIVVHDSERLDFVVGHLARSLLPALIITAALAVVALVVNPLLFGLLALAAPALALAGRWLARSTRAETKRWLQKFADFAARSQFALRALTLTQVHGAERWEHERQAREIDELTEASRRVDAVQAAHAALQNVLVAVTGTAVLVIGGVAAASHDISLGGLLAFYAVATLMLRQLALMGPAVSQLAVGTESFVRLESILSAHEESPYSGTRKVRLSGALSLEEVTFGYGEQRVLDRVSLDVEAGEHLAVIGPSGSGKTSLASLVLGLYRPTDGCILFDGTPLDELDVRVLRRQIGVLLQDPVLFPGTVAENIAYGRDGVDQDALEAAASAAGAADLIAALPEGFATQIGDEGVGLSGGERQRIALARALLDPRPLLVLDEPTTYLDATSISVLMENLRALAHAPSIILITHDPGVAARADRVAHLRDGRVTMIAPEVVSVDSGRVGA